MAPRDTPVVDESAYWRFYTVLQSAEMALAVFSSHFRLLRRGVELIADDPASNDGWTTVDHEAIRLAGFWQGIRLALGPSLQTVATGSNATDSLAAIGVVLAGMEERWTMLQQAVADRSVPDIYRSALRLSQETSGCEALLRLAWDHEWEARPTLGEYPQDRQLGCATAFGICADAMDPAGSALMAMEARVQALAEDPMIWMDLHRDAVRMRGLFDGVRFAVQPLIGPYSTLQAEWTPGAKRSASRAWTSLEKAWKLPSSLLTAVSNLDPAATAAQIKQLKRHSEAATRSVEQGVQAAEGVTASIG